MTPPFAPMLSYEDVAGALDWLTNAFGFEETLRISDDEGRITHAHLELGGGLVMLGWPGPDYRSPNHHAETCGDARKWLDVPYVVDGVYVEIEDVDAHFDRARSAGAAILSEPEGTPHGRFYRAADLEGHRWMFCRSD